MLVALVDALIDFVNRVVQLMSPIAIRALVVSIGNRTVSREMGGFYMLYKIAGVSLMGWLLHACGANFVNYTKGCLRSYLKLREVN